MIRTLATITSGNIVLAEINDAGLTAHLIGEEDRPANFAAADMALAAHGYGRVGAWDLGGADHITAPIEKVDNLFNGVRAARFDDALGTTHDQFELATAASVGNGDLVTDSEFSEIYLVAGSSTELGVTKLHMVREGGTWDQHHTGQFEGLVQVARKR
jgi:hypothetical protein